MKKVLCVLCIVSLLIWGGVRIYRSLTFSFECENYLKLAADANTVEMAKPQLDKAVSYLENHNLTSGIVSIIFHNPRNDVGFFYNNLKACQFELDKLPEDATQLEESNVLMKLRETLVDEGESTQVTCPSGIEIYPYNVAYFWWSIISVLGMILFGILCIRDYENGY